MSKHATPQEWAANYQKGMATAGAAYQRGIDSVTESPMQKAAQNIDKMQAGLMEAFASGKTKRALESSSMSDWKAKAKAKGGPAMAAAGQLARPKLERYAAIAAANNAEAAAKIASMPKGRDTALARFSAQLEAAYKSSEQWQAQK